MEKKKDQRQHYDKIGKLKENNLKGETFLKRSQ